MGAQGRSLPSVTTGLGLGGASPGRRLAAEGHRRGAPGTRQALLESDLVVPPMSIGMEG